MFTVRLASETDFNDWRRAARTLRLANASPDTVTWRVGGEAGLFDGRSPPEAAGGMAFAAPRRFLEIAESVVLHRSENRFDLLYRVLWRLRDEPQLMALASEPDIARLAEMDRQVRDAEHKMHAFVRFRRVDTPDGVGTPESYAAWFEPAHRVTERAVDHFVDRMANLRFSILTPDVCAYWDGSELVFGAGVDRAAAPAEDAREEDWASYFAAAFNPARANPALMTRRMPRRYWRNLPEARLIPEMVSKARGRAETMVKAAPTERAALARRRAGTAVVDLNAAAAKTDPPQTLREVAAGVQACRRCDLWRNATQGVPGEGPREARLMFVGEQPGDQEDLRGHPFVGPAGEILDRALAEAGVPRAETYVTNAVKHFKWEPRGKRRLHKKPDAGEVIACRWWLDAERRLIKPAVVVALGATAASTVLGRSVSVTRERGPAGDLGDGATGFVTVHPSFLLRIPDAAGKAREFALFVRDLGAAYALAKAA